MQFARPLLMVLGLATFAACGGDSFADKCKEGCSESDCDGNAPEAAEVTACEESCDDAVALNEAAGCTDAADDLEGCGGDACSEEANSECKSAGAAYFACLLEFCSENPDNENC
jgi:hypothetical protein